MPGGGADGDPSQMPQGLQQVYHPQYGWMTMAPPQFAHLYSQQMHQGGGQYGGNRGGYHRRGGRNGGRRGGGYRGYNSYQRDDGGEEYYGGDEYGQRGDEGAQFNFGRDAQQVPWEELVGRIASLTFTQHGSIALQARLDEQNPEYIKTTLSELNGIVSQAMTNKYGSHLTRRLVELCTVEERTELLREIAPQLVDISKSRFGTWTIQKLVESLDNAEQINIVKSRLNDQVVDLTKCPNGNHVIKYCLQTLTPSDNQFIYEALTVDIMDIARHKYGCSMLQRCLDYATEEQARLVSDRVAVNALPLIQDAFGNYIVQYVLELGFEESSVAVVDQMVGHFADLSREKFGSNVVEKCVAKAGSDALAVAMLEIMVPGQLESLVGDPYGNYVVQGILESCNDDEAALIGERIKPQVEALMRTVYGKRIRQKLQKRFPDMFPRRTGQPQQGQAPGAQPSFGEQGFSGPAGDQRGPDQGQGQGDAHGQASYADGSGSGSGGDGDGGGGGGGGGPGAAGRGSGRGAGGAGRGGYGYTQEAGWVPGGGGGGGYSGAGGGRGRGRGRGYTGGTGRGRGTGAGRGY